MKKRIFSAFLALALCLSLLPTMAWATETHTNHNDIATAWEDSTKLPDAAGNWYLNTNVTLSETWNVPAGTSGEDVKITNLCLNGHVIKMTGSGSVIKVPQYATLNLYDCDTTTEHDGYIDETGLWHLGEKSPLDENETSKTITGGVITGGKADYGGGVNVSGNGAFTMTGGNIVGNNASYGGGVYVDDGATFVMTGGTVTGNTADADGNGNGGGVYVKETNMCFVAGTPITMADGSREPIETLKIGDLVRVFDHDTGTISTAKLFDLWKYPEKHSDAVTLHFSNEIDITVVYGHSFFDKAANKYVAVTKENVNFYVGHDFYNVDNGCWEKLIGYDFLDGEVDTYVITSEKHLNCVANGMLSNEDGLYTTLTNVFEYGNGLKIDEEKKADDLERYGLFGYEELQYVSREVYDILNLQYLNVAFGKGMITKDAFLSLEAYWAEVDPELLCDTAVQQCVDEAGETCFLATAKSVQNSGPSNPGVYLGGTIKITGNTADGKANNLYLPSGKTVTLGTGDSGNEVAIPVTEGSEKMTVGVTTSNGTGAITGAGYGTAAQVSCFTSDNAAYIVNLNNGTNAEYTTDDYLELVAVYAITNGAPEDDAATNHGYLTIDKEKATAGDTVTVTVKPSTDYQLNAGSLKATYTDGNSQQQTIIPTETQTAGKYTFTMPDYAVTVTAEFELIPAPSGGGSSTPTVTVPVSGDKDSVKVSATVSGGNATVKNVTAEQLDKVGTGENVTIDLSSLSKSVSGVTIPKTTLENVAASDADGLEVKLPNGTTAVFDRTTVAAVAEQAAGSNIQLVVDKENKAEQALTLAQKETVKALNDALVLDAYFVSNGKRISDFKGGEAELTVSYPTTKPVRVWYVAEDGTKELVPSTFDGKSAKFVVTHFSHYAIEVLDGSSYAACPQDNTCVYAKFTDADTKAWYHDGVHFCVDNGYMQGVSADKFDPSGTLSRAMIVTMLWRMEGEPVVNYAMSFKDVPAGQWYAEAVRWAQSTGVVDGYSADSFGPNDNVTREQLAVILYNYAKHKGIDTAKFTENTNTLSHNDVFTISDWANAGMHFCIAVGVIVGDNGMLYPQNTATRAQAASMMQRFCETVLEK